MSILIGTKIILKWLQKFAYNRENSAKEHFFVIKYYMMHKREKTKAQCQGAINASLILASKKASLKTNC